MSADNYVLIKKFKDGYYWGMGFASNETKITRKFYKYGPFKSPTKAKRDAYDFCDGIIEYGINFDDNCLKNT